MMKVAAWSTRIADDTLRRQPVIADHWDYQWAVLLRGIEHVARSGNNPRYLEYVQRNMNRFVGTDGAISTYAMADYNLDFVNPGKLLFPLYRATHDERYRRAADLLRGQLRRQPRTASLGFWHKAIYPEQMWLDGIYMACPFYAEYATTFGDTDALADVIHQITLIFEHTRDQRSGLLYHGWDESRAQPWADPRTGCSRSFWARAIGWYAMALADVLELLPMGRGRDTVAEIFAKTMAPIVEIRDPGSALWYQVLDQGSRPGNYLESSASCMFTYALAKGARHGHLPAEDRRIAQRSFEAIIERFVRTTPEGDIKLSGTCRGAGLGITPDRNGSFEYYVREPVVTNDHKGLGAFLLASVELERAEA